MKTRLCKVTGKQLTEHQYKTYGLFAGSLVKNLYRKNNNVIEYTLRELMRYPFVEELNAYFESWKAVSVALYRCGKNADKETIYNKYFKPFSECCITECKNDIPFEFVRYNACCMTHYNQSWKIRSGGTKTIDYIYRCFECDMKYASKAHLTIHINESHDSDEKYYLKHINSEAVGKCLWCEENVKFNNIWEGYDKFCYNKDCNVRYYNEKNGRHLCGEKISEGQIKNQNMPNQIGYWTRLGVSFDEAKKKVSERQNTNSIPSIMKQTGCSEIEAIEKRKTITEKWLNSFPKLNYSLISQELFWYIYEEIKDEYKEVYFATILNGEKANNGKNNEYKIRTNLTTRSLDFYIKELNKVIEFNGEYWHSPRNIRGKYTIERDVKRDKDLIDSIGCKIYTVNEFDYKLNKQKVLKDCINFIRNG